MPTHFCHPGKARIVAQDPYSRKFVNGSGLTGNRSHAKTFTFQQWDDAIAHCQSQGLDDIDFLLTFPGRAKAIYFSVRVTEPHPLVDYASLS